MGSPHQVSWPLILSKASPRLPFHTCPCSALDVPSRPQTGTRLWLHCSSPSADTSSSGLLQPDQLHIVFHMSKVHWGGEQNTQHVPGVWNSRMLPLLLLPGCTGRSECGSLHCARSQMRRKHRSLPQGSGMQGCDVFWEDKRLL